MNVYYDNARVLTANNTLNFNIPNKKNSQGDMLKDDEHALLEVTRILSEINPLKI